MQIMKICPCCGQVLADDTQFCPACGCRMADDTVLPPETNAEHPEEQPALPTVPGQPAGPLYQKTLPQQPDGGLTTAQYFWTLVLFTVPVVGLAFMLYWSFGSTCSPAKRRLARASLMKTGVMTLICALVLGALVFAANALRTYVMDNLFGYRGYSSPYYGGYWDDYDADDYWPGYDDFFSDFEDFFGSGGRGGF